MRRLRLYDLRLSRLPGAIGLCQNSVAELCSYINAAQERLLTAREAGDEGWWGTWAEVAFTLSQAHPYITCPRDVARLEKIDICKVPAFIQNQFYEYLDFGSGHMPKRFGAWWDCNRIAYERNNAVTFRDMTGAPQRIRVRTSDPIDASNAKRVFIQGVDNNGNVVATQDGQVQVNGEFVTLETTFVDTAFQYNQLTGIQKDQTNGIITIWQVDPTTGAEVLLLNMEPSETTASYRRYFFHRMPFNCCNQTAIACQPQTPGVVQVTAIAKLDLVPVQVDTDYTLIQSQEAIIWECMSIWNSEKDNNQAQQRSAAQHLQAIRLLQGQLIHFMGKDKPAVNFAPFGSARLECQAIGTMV